jgi:ABC-2 type transport system permease protein
VSTANEILAIARTDLTRVLRNRTARFFVFVFPFVIILVVGTAIAGANRYPVGLVNQDGGPLAAQLSAALQRESAVSVQAFGSREDGGAGVRHGAVAASIVIPADYDTALRSGRTATLEVLVDTSRPLPAAVRTALSSATATQSIRVGAAQFTAQVDTITFDAALGLADRLAPSALTTSVGNEVVGSHGVPLPLGFGYTAPSNLVLFVFLTSLTGATGLIETRRLGVGRRMAASPVRTSVLLGGVVAGRFSLALVQALIILVGGVVLRVQWGDPIAAFVLIAVFCAVGAGAGTLIGSLVRTPQLASSIGIPLGITLGMLGGCMWPLEIVGPAMQTVGHFTPQAWAMDGFIKLVTSNAHLADIGVQLAVLAGFAVVLLGAGTLRLRHSLVA